MPDLPVVILRPFWWWTTRVERSLRLVAQISQLMPPHGLPLGLQAVSAPLYRANVAWIAEAAAGAGCGEPSRLQHFRVGEPRGEVRVLLGGEDVKHGRTMPDCRGVRRLGTSAFSLRY
jgi:hypothetical protein